MEPEWEIEGFEGGWFEAGKLEISLLFGAILLGIHSIAFNGAENPSASRIYHDYS